MAKWTVASLRKGISAKELISLQPQLERTRARIDPDLIRLLRHPDALVREVAATILGERRNPCSIPALLKAVSDGSDYVAFDAIVAIEKCAGLETGELVSALLLNLSRPRTAARRLNGLWRIVRREVLR